MEFHISFTSSYLVSFLMGLLSSMHCIGMCGSIIGTLTLSLKPEIRNNKTRLLPYVLNYNLGRIFSYTVAGGLAGAVQFLLMLPFGEAIAYRLFQMLSAVIMIGAGFYIAGWFPRFAYIEKAGSRFWKLIEPYGRKLIPVKTRLQAFLFGMVWGWLPCGLIYAALALAATTGDITRSALTMLSFGIGTLPAVIGVGIMTGILTRLSRMRYFKQAVGLFMIILALFAALPWLNPMRLQHI
ncbi:MAG: sulfite exporter TauE/SafE family protein [Methylicorpusculum sp.]|uniref:sulfite exporter TauE/SafE family protein n=1 Tax=Methylicorpusculum sp. TaxID=2713644 RepID=UPI00271B1419|nr:sulfite exporter TauE/SafE family protein [Methylicorpusculum sp.]MDO8845540.1 sulfite exporter TauE/SafE family protein [Methylicorpusculum sp.]MDO8938965.1 sulfite exporter TauE/SafE family protein [Methylicorpusculum sp.]MDO9239061.1 sulfite exporter TauE/SafE family protein [Methylicorpusculum sp.]MDP2179297.1 sulfite exporter TauE/SafE family protein [Methylicorpusculum sp.]MDP2200491.1 sulfite exporter TauE/SafE family protein [Methylicorpusculum sp.]